MPETPRTKKTHGKGHPVTVWLPDELDRKITQIVARRMAAAAGTSRRLPSRHEWMLEVINRALAAEGAQ